MDPILIVATDFSPAATNAAEYACQLATRFGGGVHLIHAYIVPVAYGDMPMPLIQASEVKELVDRQMEAELRKISLSYTNLKTTSNTVYGDINDALAAFVQQRETASNCIVILGNGGSASDSGWLGSNTMDVLRNSSIPALAVSEHHVSLRNPVNLCMAVDFTKAPQNLNLQGVVKLVRWMGAKLHLLHIHNDEESEKNEAVEILQALAVINPTMHTVKSENIDEAIQEFIIQQQMDWLLVVPHPHGFFSSLFHHSHTKAVVSQSPVPVMAIHERKN